ncbi:M23 family metallopeptidase [Pseudomonas alcaligenes]|uniref:M23 family metallopeptidase n=1 Tax=Aquipseudomonas alcaligenes TaxID=43263 RepID=UPI002E7BB948|nr:M23 family metallopeptidase [Pseudomonas alcaligenes]MEE1948729.1 M23 family metallopeptidase [Pseudomonas alcaligenes]
MLISPPFIPSSVSGESDDAFLNRAMQGGVPGDGGFPLSFDLNWHGGIHLTAPREGGAALPVRAISNGILVYFRQPTEESSAPADHGLRYRDGWTDNGCIVLKHETEIGEGAHSTVVFYSIYMHLSKITLPSPAKGKKVYRKDELGEAGRIYGQSDRIHFEVIADQSQIANLIGRGEQLLGHKAGNGRTDSCWGDMYFFIPQEVLIYEVPPTDRVQSINSAAVAYRCPVIPPGVPPVQNERGEPENDPTKSVRENVAYEYDWSTVCQLQEGLFVRMRYELGQCTLTTFLVTGHEIGSHQEEADYEYNLYRTATNLYPRSPSAGYELLRFGRVLGPDALQPTDAAHWRQIALPTPEGAAARRGWVNLNAPTVTQFSDADFPHWQGWQLIDDDTDSDSHCQSPLIRSFLRLDDGKVVSDQVDAVSIALSPTYASLSEEEKLKLSERYERERTRNEAALSDPSTQQQIKRFICKFPTEWTKGDFDTRYGWLRKVAPGGPLIEERYNRLRKHHQELAFWEDAVLDGIEAKHWHFPPKEFIGIFRKCGWLSTDEISATFPRYLFYTESGNPRTAITTNNNIYTLTKEDACRRVNTHSINLNKCTRKYIGHDKKRISIFLAQVLLETAQWRNLGGNRRLMHEWGFGQYSSANPATEYYAAFYGRGIMQLTWAGNYKTYGEYRALRNHAGPYLERLTPATPRITATSRHYSFNPNDDGELFVWSPRYDPDIVGEDTYAACDSGGFYWVSKVFSEGININRVSDRAYAAANIHLINRLVNGGFNGYYERMAYSAYILRALTDSTNNSSTISIQPPAPKSRVTANMQKPE